MIREPPHLAVFKSATAHAKTARKEDIKKLL